MRIRTALVVGLLLVLGAAGCGRGGGDDGVATASGTAKPSASASAKAGGPRDPQADQEKFLEFAKCMREHGVPMEDPKLDGGGVALAIPEGVDRTKVDAAQKECKQYLPNGGEPGKADPEMQEKMRKYAQCMRENGVPNFPDPGDEGMVINGDDLGIDPKSDTFKKADQQCQQYAPRPPGGGDNGPATVDHGGDA